jgi:hypothetical protein
VPGAAAMVSWIIERKRLVEICPTFNNISVTKQGLTHHAVSNHQRYAGLLILGERQELRS